MFCANLMNEDTDRNVTEAILWHAGEDEKAKDSFKEFATVQKKKSIVRIY